MSLFVSKGKTSVIQFLFIYLIKKSFSTGIDVQEFGEALMMSGIVLNEDVKWISFHAGYDYGYLLKLLTCTPLPKEEEDFFVLLKLYFPTIYDIKYMMKSCENLRGGLQKIAETLHVPRIGPQHQAGSDSLLTAAAFFKMRQDYFEDDIDDSKYRGVIFGLGVGGGGGGMKQSKPSHSTSPSTSTTSSTSTWSLPQLTSSLNEPLMPPTFR